MCLNETCNKHRAGKNVSFTISVQNCLKRGDALWPLLFSFAVEWAIRKANTTHQFLVFADNVNLLGESIRPVKRITGVLSDASEVVGLEVNADESTDMFMPRHQNSGQNYNVMIANISF
jgi:hypothetical protein